MTRDFEGEPMRFLCGALLTAALVLVQCGPVRIGREAAGLAMPAGAHPPATAAMAEQAAYTAGSPDFACASGALTCVRVNGHGSPLPATFGMPFAPGEVRGGAGLAGSVGGRPVPLQMDQSVSYPDGSLRYAILSTVLPSSDSGEVLSIRPGGGAGGGAVDPAAWLNAGHDVRVVLNLYSPQVSTITLGNNRGAEPGTPFAVGDTVTVRLGDDAADTFTVRVTEKTAGGGFGTLRLLSEELDRAINASRRFRSYKIGEGGGYGTLWVTTRGGAGNARPFAVAVQSSGQGPVRSDVIQPAEPARRYAASARAMLASGRPWLAGPVAGETMLAGPFVADDGTRHPRLTARINLRTYNGADGARADVIVEDLWTYDPAPRNWNYDARIETDGRTAFEQEDVTHYHHARWHRVVWSGGDPGTFVQYDRRHLFDSRAVNHYDERLVIPSAIIEQDVKRLAASDTSVMGNANVTFYFGTTGARPDIGPAPRWSTLYLMTMDPREYRVMLANADVSGTIPIHYRDRRTDAPVSIDDHPGIVTGAWPPSKGPDKVPDVTNGDTPWSPEPAHQPSLAYVPYLVTGDRFYLEEVQFWATWNLGVAGERRRGSEGIVIGSGQTRNDAWSLRALAEAAMISPDRDPLRRYYEEKLNNNIRYALSLEEKATNPLGLDAVFNGIDRFAPWQVDFELIVLSKIAGNGYAGADRWMRWLGRSAVGLWTNEANGYCRINGPFPWLKREVDGRMITTWAELQKVNFPNQTTCPTAYAKDVYPDSPISYIVDGLSAAAVLSDIGYPGARPLYDSLNAEMSGLNYARDPTWRITPR
jgi:hypothetical protein